MYNRLPILLIAIWIPAFGMPAAVDAQSGNPLRLQATTGDQAEPQSAGVVPNSQYSALSNHPSQSSLQANFVGSPNRQPNSNRQPNPQAGPETERSGGSSFQQHPTPLGSDPQMPAEIRAALYPELSGQQQAGRNEHPPAATYPAVGQGRGQSIPETANIDQRMDPQVAQAVHVEEPKADLTQLGNFLSSLPTTSSGSHNQAQPDPAAFGHRLRGNGGLDPAEPALKSDSIAPAKPVAGASIDQTGFQELIERLGKSTLIVLACGVGFIFAAKQWFKVRTPSSRQPETSIEIKSKLQLSPKSNLYLVEAGDQRLIVASDQNGIKSVVALTDSFASTLDSINDVANVSDPVSTPANHFESLLQAANQLQRDGSSQRSEPPRHAEPSRHAEPTRQAEPSRQAEPTQRSGIEQLAREHVDRRRTLGIDPHTANESDRDGDSAEISAGLYSLASVGSKHVEPRAAASQPRHDSDDAVRKQMEAALDEHGLKDLIMQQIRSRG